MGERVSGAKGIIAGSDQPVRALQVQVSMWSVWHFCDHISAELGRGTGRGFIVWVMVRLEARKVLMSKGEMVLVWLGAAWVNLEATKVGVTDWERSGVGGKVVVFEVG